MNERPIRLLIADDHPIVREGLVAVFAPHPDFEIVAEASDGREAEALFHLHQPDVVLMDFRMPHQNGVEALIAIRARYPKAVVLMLTNYSGDEDIYRALQAGAKGYLLKDVPREEIFQAVRAAYRGEARLSAEVGARLSERLSMPDLTLREMEVLRLIVAGQSNQEIADTLFISEGTVKSHINRILAKMNVKDRTQAAMDAVRRGLVSMPD